MIETASSYWNEFPTKLFNCCQDAREDTIDFIEKENKEDFLLAFNNREALNNLNNLNDLNYFNNLQLPEV